MNGKLFALLMATVCAASASTSDNGFIRTVALLGAIGWMITLANEGKK